MTLTSLPVTPPLAPLSASECGLERLDAVMQYITCWLRSRYVLPFVVTSLANAVYFLTATSLVLPGADISLRMSPGFIVFADAEFTSNADLES